MRTHLSGPQGATFFALRLPRFAPRKTTSKFNSRHTLSFRDDEAVDKRKMGFEVPEPLKTHDPALADSSNEKERRKLWGGMRPKTRSGAAVSGGCGISGASAAARLAVRGARCAP